MSFHTLNKILHVFRFIKASGKEHYDTTPTYTNVDAGVFPATTDVLATYPGEPSLQLYSVFIYENITLAKGDKLTDSNTGESWIVKDAPMVYDSPRNFYLHVIGEKVIGS